MHNFVCDYKPLKIEPYHVRCVAVGDKFGYLDDPGSPDTSFIETKLILNSNISDLKKGEGFMSFDFKDFLLFSPMEQPEYTRKNMKQFPPDIIQGCNLHEKLSRYGYVYINIKKGMYYLKQASILAYNKLVKYCTSWLCPLQKFPQAS